MQIVEYTENYKDWAVELLTKSWGSNQSVSRGVVYEADKLLGFVAVVGGKPGGLVTYRIHGDQCEIVTINTSNKYQGIGTALIKSVKYMAKDNQCSRLWLVTTNDNVDAIRFYQKRGFVLAAIHRNAMAHSRKLKPIIPLIGDYGIPIRDEIEFEMNLTD